MIHTVTLHMLHPLREEDDKILVTCNMCDWECPAPDEEVARLYGKRHMTVSQTY